MKPLSEQIDQYLLDLAWSLWTELGIAGIKRKHQDILIDPEMLIIMTTALAEHDPRLRDEALDWCSKYHHFISMSRLRTLVLSSGSPVIESFSLFAATLNSLSDAHWPVFEALEPLKVKLSGKSHLPKLDRSSLLALRIRSLFGIGARADLISFFLLGENDNFSVADTVEIGYTKRNLAEVIGGFEDSGILEAFPIRNQKRYHLAKKEVLNSLVGSVVELMPSWRAILEVILPLRTCVIQYENKPESVRLVELRNLLASLENNIRKLNWQPPLRQSLWDSFSQWFLEKIQSLAQGKF